MTDTRNKLLEAKYFWKQLKNNQSNRDIFRYNLSAFLSAARSVTFIMQNEFNKVLGFKEWYASNQSAMEKDTTMKILNKERRMTIHKKPVSPHAHVEVGIKEAITVSESISIVVTHADGTIEKRESEPESPHTPVKTEVTKKWKWYFDDLPDDDIITACKEHLTKLESLVTKCESLFNT